METMIIGIKNEKAKQLLTDLAALDLIEIKEENTAYPVVKISELKNKISARMDEVQIDAQLQQLRSEWQRNI
jgi:hypothetical protein